MATPARTDGWAQHLERLAHWIPGLGAYRDRDGLREADQQIRTALADHLNALARELDPVVRRATEVGHLDRVPALDRIARLFQTVADRIRYAAYGYAGVFALHPIREEQLARLHAWDLQLFERLPRLQERVRALAEAVERVSWFPPAAQAAEEALRDFEQAVDARDAVARELETRGAR